MDAALPGAVDEPGKLLAPAGDGPAEAAPIQVDDSVPVVQLVNEPVSMSRFSSRLPMGPRHSNVSSPEARATQNPCGRRQDFLTSGTALTNFTTITLYKELLVHNDRRMG
jgi:hypothetical protein